MVGYQCVHVVGPKLWWTLRISFWIQRTNNCNVEKKVGSKFLTELNGITLYQNEDEGIMKCLGLSHLCSVKILLGSPGSCKISVI